MTSQFPLIIFWLTLFPKCVHGAQLESAWENRMGSSDVIKNGQFNLYGEDIL